MAKSSTTTNKPVARLHTEDAEALWANHNAAWRSTAQITSQWQDAVELNPALLKYRITGDWWPVLDRLGITLLIGREYEHFLLAMTVDGGTPRLSYMPMPHPSGIAIDRASSTVYVASTRNPNQIYDLRPISTTTQRLDVEMETPADKPLLPVFSRFFPGCLYMHDLAVIDGRLYANAVGQNAVVQIMPDGVFKHVWWPNCIETVNGPVFEQNYIQLNSIAAGVDLRNSFFSASADKLSSRRPGHRNFPVDKRGVIFSGATREPLAGGLTRPHSARVEGGKVWVDNSGYGEFGFIDKNTFQPIVKLPGWTRGLAFHGGVAFVGTSRVIPRFSQYAPGLDVKHSICGVHAIEIESGQVLGSICWPVGNQIFAIEWLPRAITGGFPFSASEHRRDRKTLFYTFSRNENAAVGKGE